MANTAPYETLQAIREEAGHHHLKNRESPTGDIDGANQDYYTQNVYLADRNYDDSVTIDDVAVYVDSVPVTVSAVNETTGQVTLDSAPTNGQSVEITYAFTRLLATAIDGVRSEAQGWINRRVKGYVDTDDIPDDMFAVFKTITRLYAAGLLLIRDYGSSADSDLSSKDGYKKMKQAMAMLDELVAGFLDDSDTTDVQTVSTANDGNIYRRSTDLDDTTEPISSDDEFIHHNGA